jgi:hypothetical protein
VKLFLLIVLILIVAEGLSMAVTIFNGKAPRFSSAHIHALLAVGVLSLVAYHAYTLDSVKMWVALVIYLCGGSVGLIMYLRHRKGNPGPKFAVIIHALFGITGTALVLLSLF